MMEDLRKVRIGIFAHTISCSFHEKQERCDCDHLAQEPQISRGDTVLLYEKLPISETMTLFYALTKVGLRTFYLPSHSIEAYFEARELSNTVEQAAE